MKPLFAAIVYILLGLLLMRGILLTTRGSYTLLVAGITFYALLLGWIGCRTQKAH